ncbi:MAG: TRAP transporter small permease subunit [Pseudochelatococcus sp.]|jgi:TRAP-type C4-dicarboxylate transport system permease small subunit|uniref:TRAP transporter small permease subunit n=1 Tax=Pseudochelatococcus sp. TaxID=2020869 RepID=UPI003D945766
MGIVNGLRRLVTVIAYAGFALGGLSIMAMMVHIGADVILRTFFGHSLPGTLEITAHWYMVVTVFAPLALLQLNGDHVIVDIATHSMTPRGRALLNAFVGVLAVVLLYYWFSAAFELALRRTAQREYVEYGIEMLPVWPVRWIYVASIAALLLAFCVTTIENICIGAGYRRKTA